ncbi:microcystin-dependent protein [Natronospira proteinivora]|uniref:Microcystin-dependent protein n=1 Tax=Natronospira proteinivora TaxID=1807133 RepID=A0ABT1GBE1_9GAMM|nr:tail fiber protein [Natronospira proteinivora]MCP1728644.1 microcystin-dependent protein [Natronospira proteinivora]
MDQFVGEIRMFAGDFAPDGWLICDGQLLPIAQYEVLFVLLGTTYGGDGQTTFGLPDLRGRVPVHPGNQYAAGQVGGQETVSLTSNQLPAHDHAMNVSQESASASDPAGRLMAAKTGGPDLYSETQSASADFSPNALQAVGGAQPHNNMMPFQVLNFIIASVGMYPTQD